MKLLVSLRWFSLCALLILSAVLVNSKRDGSQAYLIAQSGVCISMTNGAACINTYECRSGTCSEGICISDSVDTICPTCPVNTVCSAISSIACECIPTSGGGLPVCGNGILESGETCDYAGTGNNNPAGNA